MNSLGYIILSIVMAILIVIVYNQGLIRSNFNFQKRKRNILIVILGILGWLTYVFLISKSGFLKDFNFPPRFPLLLVMPAFIFIGLFLYLKRNSQVLHVIPKSWLIYGQSFRIFVELLFISSVSLGVLHPEVTLEGYNYDMFIGITALVIGFLVFTKKILSKKAALIWNYIGLAVLASIIYLFTTTIYFPSLWGSETSLGHLKAMEFPFTLVPAFLMPLAVFTHIASIIQLSKK